MAEPLEPHRPPAEVSAAPARGRDEASAADALDAFYAELAPLERGSPEQMAEAVLCGLARRLDAGEVDALRARLPPGVGALVRACDRHRGPDAAQRRGDAEAFEQGVADHLGLPHDQAFRVVTGVLTAVRDRLPDDAVAEVASQLPAELAALLRRPV